VKLTPKYTYESVEVNTKTSKEQLFTNADKGTYNNS